jgi:hypothetical protein
MKHYSSYKTKEGEMDGAVGINGEKDASRFSRGSLKERNHLEDLVVDGKTLK